jgi:formamidopyrimidine-DNA glycosylase
MPELPEVESVKLSLRPKIVGKKIKKIDIFFDGIFEKQNIDNIKKNIVNQKFLNIKRKGKWLIFILDDYYLVSHLRMEGKFNLKNSSDKHYAHDLVIFHLDDGNQLMYNDTRKFGKMYLISKDEIGDFDKFKKLGPEPFKVTLEYLREAYNRKKKIKTLLLDQNLMCGVGNIYADEILFKSNIYPEKLGKDLTKKELENIISNSIEILTNAIKCNGTTIKSYTFTENVGGSYQKYLNVSNRLGQPCKICNTRIESKKINGRTSYYCPNCQKLK